MDLRPRPSSSSVIVSKHEWPDCFLPANPRSAGLALDAEIATRPPCPPKGRKRKADVLKERKLMKKPGAKRSSAVMKKPSGTAKLMKVSAAMVMKLGRGEGLYVRFG